MKRLILILTISSLIFSQDVTDSTEVMSTDIPENFTNFGVYIGGAQLGATAVTTLSEGTKIEGVLALPNIGIYKGVVVGSFPFNVGLGYGHRGYSTKTGSSESTRIDNYLDLMIGSGYPIGPVNLTGTFLYGISLGSGKIEENGTEVDYPDEDFGEYPDYGLIFGVNYPINESISLDAGYYLGLAEVNESVKFNGITFSLGYRF